MRVVRTLGLVALLATGCSVIGVRGPRSDGPASAVVCDSTYVPPAIDTAIALAGLALMVWGMGAHRDPEGHTVTGRNFAAAPGFAITATFGLAAVSGFTRVAACKRAARRGGPRER